MRTLLLTLTTCLLVLPAQARYSGGSGTAQDPYKIATAADLIALGATPADYDKHFILTADIDLDPNLPGRKVFDRAAIAPYTVTAKGLQGTPFTGVFDGNGRTISHLTITGGWYLGLFGKLASGAEVKNLGVVMVNIVGSAIAVDYVGGLVGYNDGFVTQCYSTGMVSGTGSVGGLVGQNSGISSAVTSSYSTVAVSASGEYVGGLMGSNRGLVAHCYSTGAVSGPWFFGGLVGNDSSSGTVTACFWDVQTSGRTISLWGTGKSTAQMQAMQTYLDAGWDFVGEIQNGTSQIWQMPEGGGYPVLAVFNGHTARQLQGVGTAEDPYLIHDALELGAMVYYSPYGHYRLATSIDLSGIRWATAVIPWFAGTFDGNNLEISHLTINGGGYLGLFGQLIFGTEVRDLRVVDVNITGRGRCVGALVGYNSGTVTQGYSTGSVRGTGGIGTIAIVGGMIGWNTGSVTKCYSSGVVTGAYAAGLVGHNWGTVAQCCSSATVRGGSFTGGLVGENGSFVTQCYSAGPVSGDYSVGGLVGQNYGAVTQCYSTGAVSGRSDVGGLVGYNGEGTVTQCYSTGAVSGGGLVGSNIELLGGEGVVTHCFWDTQTSGQATSDGGTGKTTPEMQSVQTFLSAGWDFVGETKNGTEDIWWILEGKDYPRLWWEAQN